MDNADTLDRVRRGKESVTDKHSVPPANLDADLRERHDRWQWIRELKSGTFDLWEKALVADLDEALRRLRLAEDQIQLYKLQPERTSDVAGLLREAAEIMREFEANVSDPHDRVCACCAIAGRGTRAHAPDCPVTVSYTHLRAHET